MEIKSFYKKYENWIIASVMLIVLLLLTGLRYDYYYDLNDDVMIKDIMAGVYTGEPESHNIQIMYPLSLIISGLYRILPGAPVYGVFLCLCQYGCLWLVMERSLCFGRRSLAKIIIGIAETVMIYALLLGHLIFVQYTFTSAMLAAAAAFLFITIEQGLTAGSFIRKSIPSILLAILSYLLRTEMLALLLPLICVAGVYRWSLEQKIFIKENFIKYFTVFGAILAGLLAGTVMNGIAFGGEWTEYVKFFNSRTELYDFQGIPSYVENEKVYEALGITESEQYMLLDQYNFGLDNSLDATVLDRLAEYQEGKKKEIKSFAGIFIEKAKLYKYRTFHKEPGSSSVQDDYPWNYMVILGYFAVFAAMLWKAAGRDVWKLIFLFGVRTALWMYILIRGRDPERITHSLYLMEFAVLAAMFCAECILAGRKTNNAETKESYVGIKAGIVIRRCAVCLFPAAVLLVSFLYLPEITAQVNREYSDRAAANVIDRGMKEYCWEREENFYFFDVYSSISYPFAPYQSIPYSEKMFADVDNGMGNYDIMGGWLVKSPYYDKKLQAFALDSMSEGILYHDNVYVMAELNKGTDYFSSYFEDQGIHTQILRVDTIGRIIGVYKIKAAE